MNKVWMRDFKDARVSVPERVDYFLHRQPGVTAAIAAALAFSVIFAANYFCQ